MTVPAWLPNWRDASQYPSPSNTSAARWAWEFLRRNQEYQHSWQTMIAPYITIDGEYDDDAAMEIVKRDRIKRKTLKEIHVVSPAKIFMKKFGITTLCDPANKSPTIGFDTQSVSYLATSLDKPRRVQTVISQKDMIVRFRMDWPLRPQIERAEKRLKERQQYLKKHHGLQVKAPRLQSALYQDYLRVLDGRLCGSKAREIADSLFPSQPNEYPDFPITKRIRNYWDAAKKMQSTEYLFIVANTPK
ncbi:MAG: transcriptional regulator domain-containing protein [Rickettsiales bacterium]